MMEQNRSCKNCQTPFTVAPADLQFYDRVSPTFANKKYSIPPPTHCPDCRQQRRLAFCNERYLYSGACDLCRKKTLTQYPPTSAQKKYCRECWHSDQWDPRDYGRPFDFSRPFFEQMKELVQGSPAQALAIDGTNENSEYIHYAGSSKNSYLIMHADFCEDCLYGYGFKKDIACVDGFYNLHCELCYDCVDVHKCYDLKGSQDCISCSSSAFLRDCVGCQDCFLCVGLRNKKYCFENEQLTKEEYQKRIAAIDLGSYQQYQQCKKRLQEIEKTHPFKFFHGSNTENCSGDHLSNCKNTQESFDCEDVEDAKFCYQIVLGSKNIYDIYQYGTNLRESYEGCIVGANSYHLVCVLDGHMASSDLTYCWYMESCKNCFGCAHMHHQKYCILNKQYTKEDYEALVPKIIEHMKKTGEWGEFFPIKMSLFGYNKTTAQLYYPMTQQDVAAKGWQWDEYEVPRPNVATVIPAKDLPDNISNVSDDILEAAIECEVTKKLFKIQPNELRFYRRQNLPLPHRHPDQRHMDRFQKRNPRRFWNRSCAKCHADIRTTYAPDRPEIVYCEGCYLKAVY